MTGLAALSLDALASVAYGPEAIVLVLALAGGAGLGLTVPVTASIAVQLLVLTVSYRQVIAAFPEGGGAYGVSKRYLGRRASQFAAASLIVDYVLNVAVSVAAGVAALTSAFPELLPQTTLLCLVVLVLITAVNYRGIAGSARAFAIPAAVYVGSLAVVIVVGLLRDGPATALSGPTGVQTVQSVGVLLLLRAFANGCAALTGVEAIANAVPSFRRPGVRRAQRAEVVLGVVLGTLLLGIAVLIEKFGIHPVDGVTVLAQVTSASVGTGAAFYVVQVVTMLLLALAANTSFGGLPVLARLLARDNPVPHVFALRAERQVHRYGIGVLAVLSALLLVLAGGRMNVLVPLFAIGVFVGFTLSQAGMVRHWVGDRPPGWRAKAALNGFGALLTGVAAVVVTASKLGEGAWLIVVVIPLLVAAMEWVSRKYDLIGRRLGLGAVPPPPVQRPRTVVVPVAGVNRLTSEAISAARALGRDVVAVHVCDPENRPAADRLTREWQDWDPGVPLVLLDADPHQRLARPVVEYLRRYDHAAPVVLIAEVEPEHSWLRILQNQRGAVLARAVRRGTNALVCRLRFPVLPEIAGTNCRQDRVRELHPEDERVCAQSEGPA